MSMCRLNRVDKARKDQGNCGKCGKPITAGMAYVWWKGRYGPRYVRHAESRCMPEPYERETNPLRSEAMQGEDAHNNAASSPEDAQTAASYLRDAISTAESIKEQLEERVSNWSGTGLENSQQAESCQYSADAFGEYASEAESIADELEALDDAPGVDADEDAVSEYEQSVQEVLDRLPDWPELDLGA